MSGHADGEARRRRARDLRRSSDGRHPRAEDALSTRSWTDRPEHLADDVRSDVALDLGWGRLLFGQTFADHDAVLDCLRDEEAGRRDVCLYVREPQVLVSRAPQELFLDPSHTYRLWLHGRPSSRSSNDGLVVRALDGLADAEAAARLTAAAGMVPAPPELVVDTQRTRTFQYIVVEDAGSGDVVGTITGIDHVAAFDDPEGGTSLWALAVARDAPPGVGAALVSALADKFQARGRAYLDLSVVHDNDGAIALYEKLGFQRVPVYCVKRKNEINEPLFTPPSQALDELNPYARIVADEALRRGVSVDVVDAKGGFLRLRLGGRTVTTRESLSELTSGVAVALCDDKRVTRRVLGNAGVPVPAGIDLPQAATADRAPARDFLAEHGTVVVKPARGEQGHGITCNVTDEAGLDAAIDLAATVSQDLVLEEHVTGDDLRVLVIDGRVVAAAVRRPPEVVGTGDHTIRALVQRLSRRRNAQTDGEAAIPLDEVTRGAVEAAGHDLDDVLPAGERLRVRDTANLHQGGTLHDVTEVLDGELAATAVRTADVLDIPVVGVDLLVDDPADPETAVVIEANERPGLANHEPHPTAAAFLDLLFPSTAVAPHRATTVRDREEHRAH